MTKRTAESLATAIIVQQLMVVPGWNILGLILGIFSQGSSTTPAVLVARQQLLTSSLQFYKFKTILLPMFNNYNIMLPSNRYNTNINSTTSSSCSRSSLTTCWARNLALLTLSSNVSILPDAECQEGNKS
jgi:hypothetical protein